MADKIFPTGFTSLGSLLQTYEFPVDDGTENKKATISLIPVNLVFKDEGTANADRVAHTVDFVGAGVSTSYSAGTLTVTIAGGGGISDGDKGDITVSGSGATWTIDNSAVSYAKIQNVSATDMVLGRSTAGAGVVEEILCTSFGRSLIAAADAGALGNVLNEHGFAVAKNAGWASF